MRRFTYVIFTFVLTCLFFLSTSAAVLAANKNIESTYYYSAQDFQTLVGTRYLTCNEKVFTDGKETPYFVKQVDACPQEGELFPRFVSTHISKTCNVCEKVGADCQQVGCPPNFNN